MIRPAIADLRGAIPSWMICYVLLGLVQNGMVPIILPLAAGPGPASGLTYAAFAASGIAAPFIGAWSDRRRQHRLTLAVSLGVAGLGLLAHAIPGGIAQHMASAALVGLALQLQILDDVSLPSGGLMGPSPK